MRILSVTAQKPHSTGSGVYLSELVRGFSEMGCAQAVVAGICREDTAVFPPGTDFFPVYYESDELPFPVAGMSDEMPYPSTVYSRMTPEMTAQFRAAFEAAARRAVRAFRPDVILCHHLYLLTALMREWFPDIPIAGVCHGTGLRQLRKNPLERAFILSRIAGLDRIFALHGEQKKQIAELSGAEEARITAAGSGYNDRIFFDRHLPRDGSLIFAGKLSEKKGVMSLIRCLGRVRTPLTLKLAGGCGNEREMEEIRALARECPHPIVFAGRLDQPSLARAFCESTAFVLPSFYEGLPLVLTEALACGLRVISTDLPGVRPWMDQNIPGNGIRFVPPPAMANADEPLPDALPGFEAALADQIAQTMADGGQQDAPDLRGVSWRGVCARMLEQMPRK